MTRAFVILNQINDLPELSAVEILVYKKKLLMKTAIRISNNCILLLLVVAFLV